MDFSQFASSTSSSTTKKKGRFQTRGQKNKLAKPPAPTSQKKPAEKRKADDNTEDAHLKKAPKLASTDSPAALNSSSRPPSVSISKGPSLPTPGFSPSSKTPSALDNHNVSSPNAGTRAFSSATKLSKFQADRAAFQRRKASKSPRTSSSMVPRDESRKYEKKRGRDEFECDEEFVIYCCKRLTSLWELDLIDAKDAKGQKRLRLLRGDLDPFLEILSKRSLSSEILQNIHKMIQHWEKCEYREANVTYMNLSIGKMTWPIGGINLGLVQTKIRQVDPSEKHIMDSDQVRKYLRALKSLLTYVEKRFPEPAE